MHGVLASPNHMVFSKPVSENNAWASEAVVDYPIMGDNIRKRQMRISTCTRNPSETNAEQQTDARWLKKGTYPFRKAQTETTLCMETINLICINDTATVLESSRDKWKATCAVGKEDEEVRKSCIAGRKRRMKVRGGMKEGRGGLKDGSGGRKKGSGEIQDVIWWRRGGMKERRVLGKVEQSLSADQYRWSRVADGWRTYRIARILFHSECGWGRSWTRCTDATHGWARWYGGHDSEILISSFVSNGRHMHHIFWYIHCHRRLRRSV